jgi:zinc/manganese transport system permease protein
MVAAFAAVLVAAALARILLVGPLPAWRLRRRYAAIAAGCILALALLAQSAWLMVSPAGDHPLLAAFEMMGGLGPERFLTPAERGVYADAAATELRHRSEVERLRALEREARWKGEGLAEEELRRVASFQQTFNEMGRGERFVQEHLRAVARARERWYVGAPAALVAALMLLGLLRIARS